MLSTIGTARGTTHVSCLHFASGIYGCPEKSTVFWGSKIVAGSLKATLK